MQEGDAAQILGLMFYMSRPRICRALMRRFVGLLGSRLGVRGLGVGGLGVGGCGMGPLGGRGVVARSVGMLRCTAVAALLARATGRFVPPLRRRMEIAART